MANLTKEKRLCKLRGSIDESVVALLDVHKRLKVVECEDEASDIDYLIKETINRVNSLRQYINYKISSNVLSVNKNKYYDEETLNEIMGEAK